MKYNPDIHHRKSIRLKGYDYSQPGAYFITICTQNRKCLFGEIANGKMAWNVAARMVDKWHQELPQKFNEIVLDEYIIMPNHIHCIIQNICPVGADLRVCPDNSGKPWSPSVPPVRRTPDSFGEAGKQPIHSGEHTGSPLHKIVQWFKTMTTNEYIQNVKNNGWQPFDKKLWQRNYYEHIIRNENELNRSREYVINNPLNWDEDEENPDRKQNRSNWFRHRMAN